MSGMLYSLLFLFIFYFYLTIYVFLLLFFMCLDFHCAHEGCYRSVYITCSVIMKWQQ